MLTYPEVGATRHRTLPAGYGHVLRDARLGTGRRVFEAAADGLAGWRMHRRAGFTVTAEAPAAATGVVVVLGAGWGPLRLTIPCRVVYTVADENVRGFAYGTLPGHPERGEEAFLVALTAAGEVRFRIRAFSRPASLLARCGGPLTRRAQQLATDRYVTALRAIATEWA